MNRASIEVSRRDLVPKGTGDLLGALWLAHLLHGLDAAAALHRSVNDVDRVIARSADADELQLAPSLRELAG